MPRPIPAHPGLPLAAAAVALSLVALAAQGGHIALRAQPVDTHRTTSQGLELVLRGKVVAGATPQPASGLVFVHPRSGHCEWSVYTDANGEFERRCHDLAPGELLDLNVIRAPHFDNHAQVVEVPAAGTAIAPILIQLTPTDLAVPTPLPDDLNWTPVRGHVFGLGGAIPGARVSASGGRSRWWSPVITDGAGEFEIWSYGGHGLDRVDVRVEVQGYATWSEEYQLGVWPRVEALLTPLNHVFLPMIPRWE